jgi:membrane-bound serine protease (ClpP class)
MRFACKLAVSAFLLSQWTATAAAAKVVAITVDGVVHPITVEILSHALEHARNQKADLILIRLNTPGGLIDATRRLVEQIDASPVPVVTFVTPSGGRAASAGFFLLQAGDVAAMAFGTNTGAASPVLMGAEMDPVMRKKVENDAAASLRSQATKRGRNAALAEKAVFEAKSFSDREALDAHLIDLAVRDEAELLQKLHLREITRFDGSRLTLQLDRPEVVEYALTIRERLMSTLSDPNLAFLMLILGALCIYLEFSAPGMIAPGVFGAILVLLGLSAMSVLPINWMAAGLIVVGLSCFVLEAKFTSHGVLGAGGVIALVLGALFLVEGPPEMRIRLGTALGVALPFGLITGFLVVLVVRARANKVVTGASGMIDRTGVSVTDLSPKGMVLVSGEYWNAVSTRQASRGAAIRVLELNGLLLKVAPLEETAAKE